MLQFYLPTGEADDWKPFLAQPDLHWKPGFSARTLAYCWERSKERSFPAEVKALFATSGIQAFQAITPLLAFPEHGVSLPGSGGKSQSDLFVLAKDGGGQLMSIVVEGKVDEGFGKTLAQWYVDPSPGKQKRLKFLQATLDLPENLPLTIQYQLLHRTASAILEAQRFNAHNAIMLIHSFSPRNKSFEDYQAFAKLFDVAVTPDHLSLVKEVQGVSLYMGWVRGDPQCLLM